jgi:hypothetical protein
VQVIQQIEATQLQADPDATEIKFMVGALLGSLPFSCCDPAAEITAA